MAVSSIGATRSLYDETVEMHIYEQHDSTTSKVRRVRLKIYERVLDTNDKEVRTELTCARFEYIWVGGVTKATYPAVAQESGLRPELDFDDYARTLMGIVKKSTSDNDESTEDGSSRNRTRWEARICRDGSGERCRLTVLRSSDYSWIKVPVVLRAMQDKELISFLQAAASKLKQRCQKKEEQLIACEERRKAEENEKEEYKEKYEQQLQEYRDLQEKCEEVELDKSEFKFKFDGADEERKELREDLEEALLQNEQFAAELAELREDKDALKRRFTRELDEARNRYDIAELDLREASDMLKKLRAEMAAMEKQQRVLRQQQQQQQTKRPERTESRLKQYIHQGRDDVEGRATGGSLHEDTENRPGSAATASTAAAVSCDASKLAELAADLQEKTQLLQRMGECGRKKDLRIAELEAANKELEMQVVKADKLLNAYRYASPSTALTTPTMLPSARGAAYATPLPAAALTPSAATHALPPPAAVGTRITSPLFAPQDNVVQQRQELVSPFSGLPRMPQYQSRFGKEAMEAASRLLSPQVPQPSLSGGAAAPILSYTYPSTPIERRNK